MQELNQPEVATTDESETSPAQWIVQIGDDFYGNWRNELAHFDLKVTTMTGGFQRILASANHGSQLRLIDEQLGLSPFTRYVMPCHHMWPVSHQSENFIERATQGLFKKFSQYPIVNIQVFSPQDSLRAHAQNLRGRLIQVFEPHLQLNSDRGFGAWRQNPSQAPADRASLQVCLTATCLYAGISSPRAMKSFFAGGRRFIKVIHGSSRAAGKIVEALETLPLCGLSIKNAARILELGASPGGITRELLNRGFSVTPIDRAAIAADLMTHPNCDWHQIDVRAFTPSHAYDALVCDMNGPAQLSMFEVTRLASHLEPGSPLIFTLKIPTQSNPSNLIELTRAHFKNNGLQTRLVQHLFHNRSEVTFFLEADVEPK